MYYTSHFFLRGQNCDETGRGRSSEVQFFCCVTRGATSTEAYIESITEPSLCKYRLRVCVPSLCVGGVAAAQAAAIEAATAATQQQQQQQQQQQSGQSGATAARSGGSVSVVGGTGDVTVTAGVSVVGPTSAASQQPRLPPREGVDALLWTSLVGDNSAEMRALTSGDYLTSTAAVRSN